jgi:hypothetical protein
MLRCRIFGQQRFAGIRVARPKRMHERECRFRYGRHIERPRKSAFMTFPPALRGN